MSIEEIFLNLIRKSIKKDKSDLHSPYFDESEKKILIKCIESTYVSSVGRNVDIFETLISKFTRSKYAIAVVNGTSAIHLALKALDITENNEVLVPSLTFVGTGNAIFYSNAIPHLIDCNNKDFGIDLIKLENYLTENTIIRNSKCINIKTKRHIKAILPVHLFGHPINMEKLLNIADRYNLEVIEDAAEALGSYYKKKHVGTFGRIGVLSFNGNKTITTGGGGMILTNDKKLAKKLKHLSTTAKLKHPWKSDHDVVGYNYRMPNINAALGIAQFKKIKKILKNKKLLHEQYKKNFLNIKFCKLLSEPVNSIRNFWLQTIYCHKLKNSDVEKILNFTNKNNIQTRLVWTPLHKLEPFKKCPKMNLKNTNIVCKKLINVPSNIIFQ